MNIKTIFRSKLVKTSVPLLALAAFAPGQPVMAGENDFAKLVNRGNAALTEGQVDKALEDYQQAAALAPNRNELKYNEAIALYRQGDTERARQLFAEATATRNGKLEAKARFNLANCDYTDALKLAEQDRDAAIEKARSAISHYRGSLAADANDSDARANIELASLLINKLQEEQKQEEEQKQDEQQQQDQQQDQQQQDQQQDSENQGPTTRPTAEPGSRATTRSAAESGSTTGAKPRSTRFL